MKMNRDEQEAKVISSSTNIPNSNNIATSLDDVDETRQRIEAWMGLGSNSKKTTTRVVTKKNPTISNKPAEASSSSSFDEQLLKPSSSIEHAPTQNTEGRPTLSSTVTGQSQRLKSILRSPKYSNRNLAANGELDDPRPLAATTSRTTSTSTTVSSSSSPLLEPGESNVPPLPMKGGVVECLFPVGQPLPQRETPTAPGDAALAIEGYTPLTTASTEIKPKVSFKEKNGNLDDDDDDSDASSIVLSSMDDLFDLAHRARKGASSSPASQLLDRSMASLETDLEFSCMTAEEFEDLDVPEEERRVLQEEERRLQYEIFSGRMDAFDVGAEDESFHHDDVDNDDEPNFLLHPSNADHDEDQALIDVSQPQDDENDVEDEDHILTEDDNDAIVRQPSEARAFLLLWTAITQWVTPHSVALLEEWKGQQDSETSNSSNTSSSSSHVLATVADRSDVEASRCAGLQAMLKMNLPRIMEELHQPQELRRFLDIHLAELLSTFDYTYPISVKMDMDMWRAMTCVFVDMVLMFSSKEQQSKYVVAVAANPKPLNNHTNSSSSSSNNNDTNDSENKPNQDNTNQNVRTFPESAKAAGLKLEEYRYLVQSAITTLGPRQDHD